MQSTIHTPKRQPGDGEHTNPVRNARRSKIAKIGARQFKKLQRAIRRLAAGRAA